jgi:hypothetical protein
MEDRKFTRSVTRRSFLTEATALAAVVAGIPNVLQSASNVDKPVSPLKPWRNSIGWGYRVTADSSYQTMLNDMLVMQSLGSNTVWLTHANPGWEVNPAADEAGFSLKDFVAISQHTTEEAQARKQLEALHHALEAAKNANLQIVLSTGYQTCAGKWWSEQHPADLRRTRDGKNPVRKGWGNPNIWYASFDSPRFRALVENFAQFVQNEVLAQHPGTNVVAIVNADEPTTTDYSRHADRAFKDLYGLSMAKSLQSNPSLIGEFQSKSWGRFAAWSADIWLRVNPSLWNLNTFHFERTAPWFPSIGAIFEMARPNMAVSYDTHPQDTALHDPFSAKHPRMLKILARTVAFHAKVQGQQGVHASGMPLMLWAGANRWSLNFAHNEPQQGHATIQDAVTSVYDVVRETKRVGGNIHALLAWHYNIPSQRLPEEMQQQAFRLVSKAMQDVQSDLSEPSREQESPSLVLSYNERAMLSQIGKRGIFDLYDKVILPDRLRRLGLDLDVISAANSVILAKNTKAYASAMNARNDVREIVLF